MTDNSLTQTTAFTRPLRETGTSAGLDESSYNVNDVIRGLYRIVAAPKTGGFGRVFHVHHTGWDVDLAMKQPQREMFRDEQQKMNFIKECDVWINLGLHPHIVSCYYVREIDGIPSIFSEWMTGGSLKDWIYRKEEYREAADDSDDSEKKKPRPGKLYDGGEKTALERILDISIQSACGLRYAHKQKVIHRDVKPDNLLMAADGTAKVADFGIADAASKVVILKKNNYTLAYCSPEQWNNEPTTIRTDIWSWAVSVLEMFLCQKPWDIGVVAGIACEEYFRRAFIPVPESMKKLLRACFSIDEAGRPANFAEIEVRLREIYQSETGNFYARSESKAAVDTADSLNNKALSYLDMGMTDDAETCWEKALEKQPDHLACIFNQTVYLWRKAQIDDVQAADTLGNVYENHRDSHDALWFYANLCLERCDYQTALRLLNDKKELFRDRKYSAFLHAAESLGSRPDRRALSDGMDYTGLLHLADDGASILSCSGKGIEKWTLGGSGGIPEKVRQVNKFAWDWEQVKVFCFSDDGKYVLTLEGKEDGNGHLVNGKAVCLWTVGGQCLRRFVDSLFRSSQPKEACFSQDRKHVLTVAWDDGENRSGELKTWDIDSGKCLHVISIDEKDVSAVSFGADRQSLATGNIHGEVKLFDTHTGTLLQTFREKDKQKRLQQFFAESIARSETGKERPLIRTLRFTPDGRCLAAVYSNSACCLWNIADGKLMHVHKSSFGKEIHFFPDARHAYSVFPDCKLIDTASGRCINTSYDFIPDSNILYLNREYALATADIDCESPKKGLILIALPNLNDTSAIRWSLSRIVNTQELEKRQRLFRQMIAEARTCIQKKDLKAALKYLEKTFGMSSVHRPARQKLSDEIGKYCRIKGLRSLTQERTVGKANHKYGFSPEGYVIADGRLYDIINNKYLHKFDDVLAIYAFSPDNKYVYGIAESPGRLQPLKAFDMQTGKQLFLFDPAHSHTVNALAVSRDGKYLLSGSDDKTARLWNIGKRTCTRVFTHEREVRSVFFGPDTRTVVTLSAPAGRRHGVALMWDMRDGKKQVVRDPVCSIYPNHNHTKWLLGRTGGLEVIDSGTLETLATCRHKHNPHYYATDVRFFPDERHVISSGSPGFICCWDVAAGKHLLSLRNESLFLSMHPGGNYAIGYDDKCYLLRFDRMYEFPGWTEWDEGAQPYLENFRTLYPDWTKQDVKRILIPELQKRGYGWLKSGGVQAQLQLMGR
jgi:WD40 repeat protein/serine/threonine protein kinase